MNGLSRRAVHLAITGKVQGVGYRDFLERQAKALGLGGWVRNRRDGSVEAVVVGPASSVETIIVACRRGPPAAAVREVQVAEHGGPLPDQFTVLPTR
jgi:acylphosphatase